MCRTQALVVPQLSLVLNQPLEEGKKALSANLDFNNAAPHNEENGI
jgi:hypothetical protein